MGPRIIALTGLLLLAAGYIAARMHWAAHPVVAVAQTPVRSAAPASRAAAPTPAPVAVSAPLATAAEAPKKRKGGKHSAEWEAYKDAPAAVRQAAGHVRKRYAALFADLQLPADKQAQLVQLLINERVVPPTYVAAGDDPEVNRGQFAAEVAATRMEIEAEIKTLLGPDDYAEYVDFNASAGATTTLARMEAGLKEGGQSLSADQSQQLEAVLKQGGSGWVSRQVLEQAQTFLTPQQMQILMTVRAQQVTASLERLRGDVTTTTSAATEP